MRDLLYLTFSLIQLIDTRRLVSRTSSTLAFGRHAVVDCKISKVLEGFSSFDHLQLSINWLQFNSLWCGQPARAPPDGSLA